MSWEEFVNGAEYVPAIVLPEMDAIVARAIRTGAKPPLEYIGTGMTAVVFCVGDVAYKVARGSGFLADEAEWLETAKTVPWVKDYVASIQHYDARNDVIVRECPMPGPDMTPYRYGEGKLFDLHQEIRKRMIPHGWTAPEFKPDSYVITDRGPVLVDASMPARVGKRFLRYTQDLLEGRRESDGHEWPSNVASVIRMEIMDGRITQDEAESTLAALARLEAAGNKWNAGAMEMNERMYEASSGKRIRLFHGTRADNADYIVRNGIDPNDVGSALRIHLTDSQDIAMKYTRLVGREAWGGVGPKPKYAIIAITVPENRLLPDLMAWSYDERGKTRNALPEGVQPSRTGEGFFKGNKKVHIPGAPTTWQESLRCCRAVVLKPTRIPASDIELIETGMREETFEMRDGPAIDKKRIGLDLTKSQQAAARAEIAAARQAASDARSACTAARQQAIDTCANAKSLRVKRDALIRLAHEYRMIRRAELARARKAPSQRPGIAKSESDDEVRQNIPPELLPTWEKMKRAIKNEARKSRTETFLEWVEAHPSEIVFVEPSDADFEQSFARRRVSEKGFRAGEPSEQQIIDYFIFDADDADIGLFSRAPTDEVADHFRIEPVVAFRLLDKLAKKKLLSKTRDILKGSVSKKTVGYQWWEYYWRPGDLERYDERNGL